MLPAMNLPASANIPKPQLAFMDLIDNSEDPWRPRLHGKPWALVEADSYEHPYSYELENLEFSSGVLDPPMETTFGTLDATDLVFVKTPE